MGIQPIGSVGTTPVVYNVRKLEPLETNRNQIQEITERLREIGDNNSRKRFDSVEFSSDGAPQDFKAVNLIKKSEIPPPEPPDISETRAETAEIRETIETEKLTENSATVKTSAEIEEQSSASKLTPSQKQGVEEYQKVQNYISPLNMSNARIAV